MNDLRIDFAFRANCNNLQLDLFTNNILCNFNDQLILRISKLCAYVRENNVVKMKD